MTNSSEKNDEQAHSYTHSQLNDLFEKSVVEVIRRFAPERENIVVPPECLRDLKEMIRERVRLTPRSFVDAAATKEIRLLTPITGRRGSNDSAVDDEDSRMSCDSSEGCNEDGLRSPAAVERIHKSSSSNSIPEFKGSHKKMSRAKRLQELRNHRRESREHKKFVKIRCINRKEFPNYFFDWYTEQIVKCDDVIYLYYLIINSARYYFERCTFPINVNRMLIDFLRDHGIMSYRKLISLYENSGRGELDGKKQFLEMQIQILLDLYCITLQIAVEPRYHPEDPDWYKPCFKEILYKLRFLYISTDSQTLKGFMDECVGDIFNHIIPKEIAKIFDNLCIDLPADLEEYEPKPWTPDDNRPCARRLRVREETSKKLQAMLIEDTASDTSMNSKDNGKKKANKTDEPCCSTQDDPVPVTPKRRERQKFIPETPEEKLLIKEEQYTEVVKQTPMGKLRQSGSRRISKKLTELIKISEERTRPPRAAAVASEKANRAIMSTAIAPNATKEVLFALHTPSARPQRTARANLIDRFVASPSASSSTPPKKSRMTDSVAEEPERKKTRSSVTASPPAPESSNGIPGLGKEQILEYKKRMSEITKQRSPTVAGASTRARTGLFEETEVPVVAPKSAEAVQKNRTGREVRSSTTVHLAHILFNVHNPAPLLAFNPAKMKLAGNRLQRLVRIAKKSQKVRLMRLRNRVRQSQAAEAAAANSTPQTDATD